MNLNALAQSQLDELESRHLRRRLFSKPDGQIADFSSNDYLGLSTDHEVIRAGTECAQRWGAGATGSRLLSGNLPPFESLEKQLADFKRSEAAMVFSSGYQANSSALSTLMSPKLLGAEPLVFVDRLIHASLHHACRLLGLRQQRYRHNDLEHLSSLLEEHALSPQPKFIVTESVFGMDGDTADLVTLAQLALQHDAVLWIDEAHATGVLGPQGRGLGALEHPAISALKEKGHWLIMGTFSKALGTSGAYLACSQALKDYLVGACGGFVYSTAPSPFVIGATSEAIRKVLAMDQERQNLALLAEHTRTLLAADGWDTRPSATHIIPILTGDSEVCLKLKQTLRQGGFEVSAVRPPTVPKGEARLRLALNTGHTQEVVEQFVKALHEQSSLLKSRSAS